MKFVGLFLFTVLVTARVPAAEQMEMLVLDPLAAKNACACVAGYAQRDYDALAVRLGETLKVSVSVKFGAVLAGNPSIVIGKKTEIEHTARLAGRKLTLIGMLTDSQGSTNLHGLFVVRAADPSRTLADLKGKRVLFGPEGSDEKRAAAMAALRAAGIPLPDPIEARDTCSQAAADVAEGRADAAVISSYAMPLLEGCGTIGKGELKIIGRTADVPFVALYVADGVREEALKKALETVAADEQLLQKLESARGFILVRTTADAGWTDWRGTNRRSHSPFVPARLPARAKFLWRVPLSSQSLGGVAATESVVIVSDKNTETQHDIWRCFDAANGRERWRFSYLAPVEKMDYTSAPRATPVISGDDVFLFSALGQLHCVCLSTGAVRWQRDLCAEFNAPLPAWGYCATPLLVDDLVVVPGGSTNAFLVALDRRTGEPRWKTPGNKSGFGNFICAEFGGRRQIVGCDAAGAGGWDPRTGSRLWTIVSEFPAEFKVPTPLKLGEHLLLVAEQSGARLYGFDGEGRAVAVPLFQNVEANPDVTSPVEADGMIWLTTYAGLCCLDGRLRVLWRWEQEPFKDAAQLIAGNGRVLILTKNGTLALVPSRPDATMKPQLLPLVADAEVWSQPALVRDRLYVRTDSELLCLSLSE